MSLEASSSRARHSRYALIPAIGTSKLGTGAFTVVVLYVVGRDAGIGPAGMVLALEAVPVVIFGLLGGVFADRSDKRRLLLSYDASSVIVCALPCILFTARHDLLHNTDVVVASAVIVSVVCAVTSGLYAPTSRAIVPFIMDRSEFARYNGTLSAMGSVSQVCGPLVGGLIITLTNDCYLWALLVNLVSFTISFLITLVLPRTAAPRVQNGGSIVGSVLECAVWIRGNRPVRRVLASASLLYFLLAPVGLVVLSQLGGSASAGKYLSICQAFQAFGAVVCVLTTDRIYRRYDPLASMSVLCGVSALLTLMLASPSLLLYVVSAFGLGFVSTLFAVSLFGVIQNEAPEEMVGRAIAVSAALSGALIPAGLFLFGHLITLSSAAAVVVATSICLAILAVVDHLLSRKPANKTAEVGVRR
ncbi:MFS transporter [Nocardia beijingensis]|uniref:MFS transporter n=1 Tax=Nocardia beijingensis TaxID=95162 RepID=UPI00344B6745